MKCSGGDVSKPEIVFFYKGKLESVPNKKKELKAFLKSLPEGTPLVVESTGRYHLLVCRLAFQLGLVVYVVNPKEFSFYRRSVKFRLKSDASDAEVLARYGEKEAEQLQRWFPPEPRNAMGLFLLRHRAVLVKARTAIALSLDGFACRESEKVLMELTSAIDKIQDKIVGLLQDDPGFNRLLKIPGVGKLTAAAMVLAFAKGDFRKADSFVAFLGLDLRFCDSGAKRGRRRLSKRGDALSRCLLYTAACSGVKTLAWKGIYQRHLDKGLAKIQAIVAVARKIAKTIWSILNHQTEFQDKRILNP